LLAFQLFLYVVGDSTGMRIVLNYFFCLLFPFLLQFLDRRRNMLSSFFGLEFCPLDKHTRAAFDVGGLELCLVADDVGLDVAAGARGLSTLLTLHGDKAALGCAENPILRSESFVTILS
jgi:hypothetical protein